MGGWLGPRVAPPNIVTRRPPPSLPRRAHKQTLHRAGSDSPLGGFFSHQLPIATSIAPSLHSFRSLSLLSSVSRRLRAFCLIKSTTMSFPLLRLLVCLAVAMPPGTVGDLLVGAQTFAHFQSPACAHPELVGPLLPSPLTTDTSSAQRRVRRRAGSSSTIDNRKAQRRKRAAMPRLSTTRQRKKQVSPAENLYPQHQQNSQRPRTTRIISRERTPNLRKRALLKVRAQGFLDQFVPPPLLQE